LRESLSEGLQNALWKLGAVPAAHRTDRLTSAVCRLPDPEAFTNRYQGLLDHYGLRGQKTQASAPHENGDVEQRHHRFKQAVDQALMLRGSRDFVSREVYELFLESLSDRLNAGRRDRLLEEMLAMHALPPRRLEACKHLRGVRVDRGSLIHVDRNVYSVNSRLIGQQVDVRLYAEHLEVWYGQRKIEHLLRLRGRGKSRIHYRHVIDWLVRKPGAFEQYRYREDLFPTSRFRMAYDALRTQCPAQAAKGYLKILYLAARENESAVDQALGQLIHQDQAIDAQSVQRLMPQDHDPMTAASQVTVTLPDLTQFDSLYGQEEMS